jgi:pyruvate kinase
VGEKIHFKDSRSRPGIMIVLERITPTRVRVGSDRTIYLKEGLELYTESGTWLSVGPIRPQPIDLQVKAGDTCSFTKPGEY